jgi:hypothetical protein
MSIICDVYVNMAGNDAVADGTTLQTTHLVTGTQLSGGASGKWALSAAANAKYTINAPTMPLRDTVIVRGVGSFPPGSSWRSLKLDTTVGTFYAELDLQSFAKSQVSMGCWVKHTIPWSNGPGALYDLVEIVATVTGNITNVQFCDGTTAGGFYSYDSETTGGASTRWGLTEIARNGPTPLLGPGDAYWTSIYSDIINGVNKFAVFTQDGRQVVNVTGSYTGSATDTAGTQHRWGNQEVGAARRVRLVRTHVRRFHDRHVPAHPERVAGHRVPRWRWTNARDEAEGGVNGRDRHNDHRLRRLSR